MRSKPLAVRALPAIAHSVSHRCCLTSGISVCTASSMSASVSRAAAVGRDAGQHPGRALLHHQPARAVDGVDDDDDLDVFVARAGGQHAAPSCPSPSATSRHGHSPRQLLEALEQHRLGHAVDGEQRVARVVAHHRRQLARSTAARTRRPPRRGWPRARGECAATSASASRRPVMRACSATAPARRSSAALASGDGVGHEVAAADLRARPGT